MMERSNIEYCIRKASRGKRKRKAVQNVLLNMDGHIDELTKLLESEQLKPVQIEKTKITEGSRSKERQIQK